jgi:hypothetical protein
MQPFYIANACFILEFMSYIILSVCAKIGETLDMKTKIMSTCFALFITHRQNCCPFLNL